MHHCSPMGKSHSRHYLGGKTPTQTYGASMTIRPYSATIGLFSDGQNRPPSLPLESSHFVDFVHVRTHHLYRSILVGKYDQGLGDQLGPNGCCDQAINSIQLATGAMVDGLKQARNFTSKTQVEGVVEGVVEGG